MVKFTEPDCLSPDLFGKDFCPPECPVRHIHCSEVFCCESLGNQEPHLAAADHKDMFPREAPDLGFGEQDRCRSDRNGPPVDLGSPADFNSNMYRFVDAELQKAAAGLCLLCICKHFFHLPDDLVLADNHRVYTGCK